MFNTADNGPSPLSESGTESSADSGLLTVVSNSLDRGDDFRDEASDYHDGGKYDHALKTYDKARDVYEEAREAADQSDLIDINKIEQKIAAVEDDRREVHRQQLQDEVESLRSALDHVETLVNEEEVKEAQERLEDLESRLSTARDTATDHSFEDLHEEIDTLERRREERLTEVTEQLQVHSTPAEIPRAPTVSVEYDALTNKEPIGGGGNADVMKATLSTADGDVTLAIKEPRMAGTLHTDAVERMLQEAETWDRLDDHDHVVGVVDYGSEPLPWIAMEYMDGGHLGARAGELNTAQAVWTAISITEGVRHAHRHGVAHLDLKPENVLLRSVEGAWDVPKVADWGLSKHLLDHSKSIEGMSPQYAAPEQFSDEYGPTDDLTDVYQLGAVFYELFTGRPPFEGTPAEAMHKVLDETPTPPSELADVGEAIDEILLTTLAKEKDDRYESVLVLRNDLQGVYDGL